MNSTQKTAQVLSDAARIVRFVTSERDVALAKVAQLQKIATKYERRAYAEKVAALMHQKGLRTDEDFSDLVTDLEKSAQEGKLGTIEEAVKMVGTDMGMKTASIHDSPVSAGHDFERFLLGNTTG